MSQQSSQLNRVVAIERRLRARDAGSHSLGVEARVGRLEQDVGDIKATLGRLEPMIVRIDAQLPYLATKAEFAQLRTEMAHLATKEEVANVRADLAEKPSRAYLWGILAVLLAAYGCGLAAIAVLR